MKKTSMACCLAALAIAVAPHASMSAQDPDPLNPQTPESDVVVDAGSQWVVPYAPPANVFVPESSRSIPADAGIRAHTNYVISIPEGVHPNLAAADISVLSRPAPAANPEPQITTAEYPASLACIYKMGPNYPGCTVVNNSLYNATGGSKTIAIVEAYHNPTARADLNFFSTYFGLPAAAFTKIAVTTALGGSCGTIPVDPGWSLESALDTQWAHAMAPRAKILLVEACDNSYQQLMLAEQVAIQQLSLTGGGQVSNSWGSAEWSTESADWDWVFRSNWTAGNPVSIFFSAGDAGLGAQYPSSSPWVVSAGGTTINRTVAGAFDTESCWAGSGGGTSLYETYSSTFGSGTGPWTNYQYPLFGQANRSTPDISFNADPASGVSVYLNGSWFTVGGTSLSAPALAGIVNNSGNFLGMAPLNGGSFTNAENNLLYAELLTKKEYPKNFYDVTTGSNGAAAAAGWDFCTGVGSPRGRAGK